MRLLDRYIFRQVFISCAACVGFFVFLMAAVNALKDMMGYLLAGQLSIEAAAKLMLLLLPYAAMYALPMGLLLGVLLVLGRLSADSELVAMRTCGLGLRRITAPIYLLAVTGVLAALVVNFHYLPVARTAYVKEFSEVVRTQALRVIVPKTFVREFKGAVVYVSEKSGDYVKDVWFWRLDRQQRVVSFSHAKAGRIELDESSNELVVTPFEISTERIGSGKDSATYDPEDYSGPPMEGVAESASFRIPLSRFAGPRTFNRKPEWYTLPELMAEKRNIQNTVSEAKERATRLMRISLVIQEKATMAVAVLTLVLLAVPLGIKVSRRETSANLGIALLLALAYYFATVIASSFEQYPEYRPDLLVWLPNAAFLFIGIWLNARVESR